MTVIELPRDDQCNGWYRLLPPVPPARRLEGPVEAHWLVIGAGFVGLAAARRLAELRPNDKVVLLEALRVGQGASGRNSGFVIDLPHKFELNGHDMERKHTILRLNRAAIAELGSLVSRHGIACQWTEAGKYQAAVGGRGLGYLDQFEKMLQGLDYPYRRLDRAGARPVFGTDYYAGAIYTPNTILMQPAALVRGLADSLPANVALYEDTPVLKLDRGGARIEAHTPEGMVRAGRLLLGTNIFSREFGFLRHRMVPTMTFASLTRPLDDAEMGLFRGEPQWGLTPADHAGTTVRLTADRRLLIRNQYRFVPRYHDAPQRLPAIREGHRRAFLARYPSLAGVAFETTWGGACGLSRNSAAFFGKLADRVYASAVHQSVGAARGTISGRLLAELATGQDSELLVAMIAVSGMPALNPPEPLLGLGVRARMKLAAWQSRGEL